MLWLKEISALFVCDAKAIWVTGSSISGIWTFEQCCLESTEQKQWICAVICVTMRHAPPSAQQNKGVLFEVRSPLSPKYIAEVLFQSLYLDPKTKRSNFPKKVVRTMDIGVDIKGVNSSEYSVWSGIPLKWGRKVHSVHLLALAQECLIP